MDTSEIVVAHSLVRDLSSSAAEKESSEAAGSASKSAPAVRRNGASSLCTVSQYQSSG